MNTTDQTVTPANAPAQNGFAAIDVDALDDVTGGCGACGQACANGPAAQAAPAGNPAALPAAFAGR